MKNVQCPISPRVSIPKSSVVSAFYRMGVARDVSTAEEKVFHLIKESAMVCEVGCKVCKVPDNTVSVH